MAMKEPSKEGNIKQGEKNQDRQHEAVPDGIEAIEAIFHQYEPARKACLRRTARRCRLSAEDQADAGQEMAMHVWMELHRLHTAHRNLSGPHSWGAYATEAGRHRLSNWSRGYERAESHREMSTSAAAILDGSPGRAPEQLVANGILRRKGQDPADEAGRNELVDRVRKVFRALRADERRLAELMLKKTQHEEIVQEFGVAESTVRERWAKLRKKLETRLYRLDHD
jgi:RNA polymerase sigma factor (sigma-70 family)